MDKSYSERNFSGFFSIIRKRRFGLANAILSENGSVTKTVIDFGCADGFALPLFSSNARRLIAVDSDHAMLDRAREKYSHLPNLEFIHSDDFDFEGDILVALEVFDHINDIDLTLELARTFLRSRDRLMILSLPLEIGLTRILKLIYGWLFFQKNVLHFRKGYDYRPLLQAFRKEEHFQVERIWFEPFGVMGNIVNRGIVFTVRSV